MDRAGLFMGSSFNHIESMVIGWHCMVLDER